MNFKLPYTLFVFDFMLDNYNSPRTMSSSNINYFTHLFFMPYLKIE